MIEKHTSYNTENSKRCELLYKIQQIYKYQEVASLSKN